MDQVDTILIMILLEMLKFLVLISTDAIDGRFGSPEKKFSIDFTIAKTKMFFSLRYNHNNSFLFVNKKFIKILYV